MNGILLFILLVVFFLCIATVSYHLMKVIRIGNKRALILKKSEQLQSHLNILDNIIESSVAAVNQKMVLQLKLSRKFAQCDMEEAFHICTKSVYSSLSQKAIKELEKSIVSVPAFIESRIEYHVRKQKSEV